ncbi:MAG: hypothetical protein NT028_08215, partial [candidate division Zixibacteria bacterium]|nr:hypothetical protein [candidate division Zixibacteria bacterium]
MYHRLVLENDAYGSALGARQDRRQEMHALMQPKAIIGLGIMFFCIFLFSSVADGYQNEVSGASEPQNLLVYPDTIFSTGFESGWGSWWADNGVWEVGHPDSVVISHSGSNCAATVLNGKYPDGTSSRLVSPAIQLPKIGPLEALTLDFWHWFWFSTYDDGRVYISVFDTSQGNWGGWTVISDKFQGMSRGWSLVKIEVSEYAGKRVRLGFYLENQNYYGESEWGWYVDEVCVIRAEASLFAPICLDFESGWDAWWTDNGVWEVGHPDSVVVPHSGSNCAATVLNGKYPDGTSSRLVSPAIQLPKIGPLEALTLRFWHWFWFSTYDDGRVYISVFDTSQGNWGGWTVISDQFVSKSVVWSPVSLEISEYSGKRVRLGFYLENQNYYGESEWGWYIDDVCIVTPGKTIHLTAPSRGEQLCVGSAHSITWSSAEITNVKIEYSTNGGSSWSVVIGSTPADVGNYTWTVPNAPSTSCRVRICDISGLPCDTSESYFTILTNPSVPTLVSPTNAARNVDVSPTQFNWSASSWATSYRLQIDTIVTFATPQYDSSEIMSTSRNVYGLSGGTMYYWRVRAINVCDTTAWSPARNFTTVGSNVTLISPVGGEQLCGGQLDTITWISHGISDVKIDFSADSGQSWQTLVSSTPSDGSYSLNLPVTSSTRCLLRICDAGGTVCDSSDGYFTINAPKITVQSPNGGETVSEGDVYSITWNSDCFSDPVKIEYSTDGGVHWATIVNTTPNNGQYDWIIPAVTSNTCEIQISDPIDGNPTDESDGTFTIILPLATIEESHPSSEEWASCNAPVAITFSRVMDPASVNGNNISINGVNDSIYSWRSTSTDNRTFYLAPDNGFFSLDTLTIRLHGTLKDSYGRCLDLNKNGKSDDCDSSISWQAYIYPLGDYNGDLIVDGNDVADFTYAWNTQDISKEIGPATGTPPHLRPAPDGKVDFEDLVVFVWMWNWFHQFSYPSPVYSPEDAINKDDLIVFQSDSLLNQGETKTFRAVLNFPKEVITVDMTLCFDPAEVQIESFA